ncbi:MAG: SAM-dependent methyltransferase [Candidatus Hydrogenedentes bacterium]|nr:SAM-dependent methyltransferase [Candidatus Hydrogenedentota bacterium]
MPIDRKAVLNRLKESDLDGLFIQELGWDHFKSTHTIELDGCAYDLHGIAEKRGMAVFHCPTDGGSVLPAYPMRVRIERQAAKIAHEHIIVFTGPAGSAQVWQWVKREPGKPAACREHHYHDGHSGEALFQKLEAIAFTLEEEESIALPDVTRRARKAFDVEKVTKKFFERFKKEHSAFLDFIGGITEQGDQAWYASVMLNRLMFVYFIQRKGFLDGDRDYLRNRLDAMRREKGKDKFYSFYRYFLLRLFHEGLGGKARPAELETLIGKIPYLNGGLFDVHELEKPERYGKAIQIPDEAFERIFDYFDQYQWHLDERPLRADNEINPDVLGYIFEKYINQKQMGAYYTKEDITEYIGKNTIIPYLFDAARAKCKVAFENPGGPTVLDLLRMDPDRYIYPAVRHGVDLPLPPEIEKGVNPPTLHQVVGEGPVLTLELRKGWNKAAPPEFALPTETWREVVARRQRYAEVKARLLAIGNAPSSDGDFGINDLITLNLDIRQFAQDVIENCQGPDLLRAFWHAIEKVTVLDPTCGSGAFLFAALNILEPLYEACLDRMEAMLRDEAAKADPDKQKTTPNGLPLLPRGKYEDFSRVLDHVAAHPNRRYFIFKSIILNNLYGVDLMEEAVEICKLRLFLKLAAQVEPDEKRPNGGIEPLPDVDFNIRAGNTLVGFASMDEIRRVLSDDLVKQLELPAIEEKAALADKQFQIFRKMQTEQGMDAKDYASAKQKLRERLKALEDELNRYLAIDYGVKPGRKGDYETWLKSHQPFHWFVDFYGIVQGRGGFDVIIGNPPYVELSKITEYIPRGYKTSVCGNIYCPMLERFLKLGNSRFRVGAIVPMSLSCTNRMSEMREVLQSELGNAWVSHFSGDANPSKLFEGVKFRLDILLGNAGAPFSLWSSDYLKWFSDARPTLFSRLTYAQAPKSLWHLGLFPKIGQQTSQVILKKILQRRPLEYFTAQGKTVIYVHRVITMFVKCFNFVPHFRNETDGVKKSDDYKPYQFNPEQRSMAVVAAINSSLFFFYFTAFGDCFHCGKEFVVNFPFDLDDAESSMGEELQKLSGDLMKDLKKNAIRKSATSARTGSVEYDEFWPSKSKFHLDQIDMVLARHYKLTETELDFIINCDFKFRMGRDA